jgi:ABC-2 type transport system ATP-binding protein
VPAIFIENLTKDFSVGFWRPRPYRALDRLSLSIEAGEVIGFLGPNGKTTTLTLLIQLIYPAFGRAEILGRPVSHAPVPTAGPIRPEMNQLYVGYYGTPS